MWDSERRDTKTMTQQEQLEREEAEFYGEEDLEREQRRAEHYEWMRDMKRDESINDYIDL